jgi:hypothetical protein
MRKTFDVSFQDISGKDFEILMDICFKYADCFTFSFGTCFNDKGVYFSDKDTTENKFLSSILPFVEKKFTHMSWFGYERTGEPSEWSQEDINGLIDDFNKGMLENFTTYICPANNATKKIILEFCSNIRMGCKGIGIVAENLCFFRNGTLFLGTVSHEEHCFFYPLTEEMAEDVQKHFTT